MDPKVVEIAKTEPNLVTLNKSSLNNPKVEIISEDAFSFIWKTDKKYDFIIADFPDPRDTATAKLYSKEFYIWIFWTLKQNWIFVTQASNSFFSNKVLFSIEKTISWVFWNALAYHKYLPSFWDWWFVVSGKNIDISAEVLCPKMWCSYFDENYLEQTENLTENTLASPRIIEYYWEWYKKYNL